MENLYNVYAWHDHNPAHLVSEAVPLRDALVAQEAYLNRTDAYWDAYIVECADDPGYSTD